MEQTEILEKLAKEILQLARNTLVINLRFMDKPISMLELKELPELNAMSVDGEHIYYAPNTVIKYYSEDKLKMTRSYLHMVFHCVYQHFWISNLVQRDYWNLACDIAVENTINDLRLPCVESALTASQEMEIKKLKTHVKYITADMLYKYFMENNPTEAEIMRLERIFYVDDHSLWYDIIATGVENPESDAGEETEKRGNGSGNGTEATEGESDIETGQDGFELKELQKKVEEWKDIAKQMKMDIEIFSKQMGAGAGGLVQNLKAVTREKYDYTEFLKKFAVMGERMKVNDDEFDYIFYTYGLQLYKKMPLIEPLEYKEVKGVKEFVIAIDTSGSTSGRLVQKFIQKTYNILKQEEGFFTRFNLHIIQCDSNIQEDVKITNQNEMDQYLETMEIKGMGGTDFRPVFSYVDNMIENGEFVNLKGLIYFTDGCGIFPSNQPNYKTAIVFVDDDYEEPEVPSWAIKLVLPSEDI